MDGKSINGHHTRTTNDITPDCSKSRSIMALAGSRTRARRASSPCSKHSWADAPPEVARDRTYLENTTRQGWLESLQAFDQLTAAPLARTALHAVGGHGCHKKPHLPSENGCRTAVHS